MSVAKLFNHPHVLWQTSAEDELPNPAIAVCIDNSGVICLRQEGNEIILDMGTVPELCKLLSKLARE